MQSLRVRLAFPSRGAAGSLFPMQKSVLEPAKGKDSEAG